MGGSSGRGRLWLNVACGYCSPELFRVFALFFTTAMTDKTDMTDVETAFEAAVAELKVIQFSKKVPAERKGILYGLYKQLKNGDPKDKDAPGMFAGFEARGKWKAWNLMKGKDAETCMKEYVEEFEKQKNEFKA